MNTHNSTDITRKVATASSNSQILDGVQSIGIDHEVSVIFVCSRRLAAVTAIEELSESLPLNWVDGVHIKPCRIAGEDNGVCLGDELFACGSF